jgi:hypothetical protein
VIAHRVDQWRKWVANGLMMQPERNQRALIALALSSRTGDCRSIEYGAVLTKIIGTKKGDTHSFADALQSADKLSTDFLTRLVQAVTASAAFGIDEANLVILLNYLHIDEANQFQIDKEFLNLFTMNELESLAEEIGLRKAMGERFATVRSGKKDAFIAALLSVKKFSYRGAVPAVMRYPRKPIPMAAKEAEAIETPHAHGSESNPTPDDKRLAAFSAQVEAVASGQTPQQHKALVDALNKRNVTKYSLLWRTFAQQVASASERQSPACRVLPPAQVLPPLP